jgi:hypothetical protein
MILPSCHEDDGPSMKYRAYFPATAIVGFDGGMHLAVEGSVVRL